MNKDQNPEQKSFEEPSVISYEQRELIVETVFNAGDGSVGVIVSDRNLKKGIRSVRSRNILIGLGRLV